MCDCMSNIVEQVAKENEQYGVPAQVGLRCYMDISVRKTVQGKEGLRRAKHCGYTSYPMRFCPICGEELKEPTRSFNVWNKYKEWIG